MSKGEVRRCCSLGRNHLQFSTSNPNPSSPLNRKISASFPARDSFLHNSPLTHSLIRAQTPFRCPHRLCLHQSSHSRTHQPINRSQPTTACPAQSQTATTIHHHNWNCLAPCNSITWHHQTPPASRARLHHHAPTRTQHSGETPLPFVNEAQLHIAPDFPFRQFDSIE